MAFIPLFLFMLTCFVVFGAMTEKVVDKKNQIVMLLRVESSSKALISFSFALHMYQFDLVLYVCMKHCDNYFHLQVVGVPWPVAL